MKPEKIAKRVVMSYKKHGANIKVPSFEIVNGGERYILSIKLMPGTKESIITERAPDIQIAEQWPQFQPFKEGLEIRIAVSEYPVKENSLGKILQSHKFRKSEMKIPLALGYDMRGEMRIVDLVKLIHAMYAGSTGSGKSIGLWCLILSIISLQEANCVNIILFDVGANALEVFSEIPHLSYPLVKDTETAIYVIQKLVAEMERRMALERCELLNEPALICVIDEYVSLISNIANRKTSQLLSGAISNLLRRGRQAKIHIVLATQDPTIKNMKVDIGNITARMAFACAKYHNSITMLGEGGAEKLPGKGAMLFKSSETPEPIYLQGAYMSPTEVAKFVAHIKSSHHNCEGKFEIPRMQALDLVKFDADSSNEIFPLNDDQQELTEVILWTLGRTNISMIQIMKKFRMGKRASKIVDTLSQMGIVGDSFVNQPRMVIPESIESVPNDVIKFILSQGISIDEIASVFANRSNQE